VVRYKCVPGAGRASVHCDGLGLFQELTAEGISALRMRSLLKLDGRRVRADNAKLGGMERSYTVDNARELERLRALVSKLSDQDLGSMVNEYWTVAGVLGHIAFWDGRALFLAGKLQRDGAFTQSDTEPENVDWINDSTRPLIHAIPPRQAAEVALRIAEETDELIASLSPELVAKIDANSPLNPVRADHRGEHLDEIEAALAGRDATRRPT